VVYADGNEVPYRCSIHPHCKLGSTLVIRCAAKISG
jgi:two-component system LytT family sensor kinase